MQFVTDDTEILAVTLTEIPNFQYEKKGKIKVQEKFQLFQKISPN